MWSILKIDFIYLGQYLVLWKVIICKTTGLASVFWELKYISWELNKMEELSWNALLPIFRDALYVYKKQILKSHLIKWCLTMPNIFLSLPSIPYIPQLSCSIQYAIYLPALSLVCQAFWYFRSRLKKTPILEWEGWVVNGFQIWYETFHTRLWRVPSQIWTPDTG